MIHDFRFALRSLARTPGFTFVSVLMLAVGIGLSIYMFGAINAFALKPLPFAQADRIVHLSAGSVAADRLISSSGEFA